MSPQVTEGGKASTSKLTILINQETPPSVGDADISPARGEIGLREILQGHAQISAPPFQQNKPLTSKSPQSFPHPQTSCHTPRAPAAGWIANVFDQGGGMPFGAGPDVGSNLRGGGDQCGSVGGPGCFASGYLIPQRTIRVQSATGTTSQSAIALWRRGGLDSGPGLWRRFARPACRVQAGSLGRSRSGSS